MKLIFTLILLSLPITANAKAVIYGRGIVSVQLPYGKETIFRFDKQVRTISPVASFTLKPASNESPDYSTLSVMPRDPMGEALIAIILEDDSTVRVKLKTVMADKKDLADPIVEFKARDVPNFNESDRSDSPPSEIELMKAMIRDDFISGFQRRELDRAIDTSQSGISARMIRQYEGETLHGYVFKVTNQMQSNSVTLDLRQLKLGKPNLAILSQADQLALTGKIRGRNETLLRVVAKSTSRYSDIRIPVGIKKLENEVKK